MKETPKEVYEQRRRFLKIAAGLGAYSFFNNPLSAKTSGLSVDTLRLNSADEITPKKLVTSYNNYYEFTTNKKMVRHIARDFQHHNWMLNINGLVDQPISVSLADLKSIEPVDRTYKLRCVEGWSAVIPWQGFELNKLLSLVKVKSKAKYVKFTAVLDPTQMPGQRKRTLPWPYIEGLRLDEAMHPLTIIATGMYSDSLSNQNGAPLRLVVPWKYGYKSIKAITEITLTEEQPISSWQQDSPSEYGFYANVNPNVAHPRWSQRRELPLGEIKKIKTKMLNGYADQVSYLYNNDELDKLI